MTRLLVVAHQTATSPAVMRRLAALAGRDRSLRVTLVVPQTALNHLPKRRHAPRTAAEAAASSAVRTARVWRNARIAVEGSAVGGMDPITAARRAIERSGPFDAVMLSTLPPGQSIWLELDAPERLAEAVDAPVLLVHDGNEDAWPAVLDTLEAASGPDGWRPESPGVGVGIRLWHIAAAMAVYIAGTLSLMLLVDRRFVLNDIVAIALFGLILGWLALDERRRRAADSAGRRRGG